MRHVCCFVATMCVFGAMSSVFAAPPERTSNEARYEVKQKPATGRSGTAALQVEALLSQTGATELTVLAEKADGATPDTAEIAALQVKLFGFDGQKLDTSNFAGDGSAMLSAAFDALVRGQDVQVQANIRGIDGRRTSVVTVVDTVRWRNDLAVIDINAPATVMLGTYAHVDAVVSELNGDTGARADCVLSQDGVEIDRAGGIWIDGGDTVTCAFAHVFDVAGPHTLSVQLDGIFPWDDDATNNEKSVSIDVQAGTPMRYSAFVEDYDVTTLWLYSGHWNRLEGNGQRSAEWDYDDHSTGWMQSVNFDGDSTQMSAFPLSRVSIEQSSAGESHVWNLEDVAGSLMVSNRAHTITCAWESNPADAASLHVCNYEPHMPGAPVGTSLEYRKRAGEVIYHSIGLESLWYTDADGNVGTPQTWSWNSVTVDSAGGERWPVGDTWSWRVSLTDANGASLYANPTADVSAQVVDRGHQAACRTSVTSWYDIHMCYESRKHYDILFGATSGQ